MRDYEVCNTGALQEQERLVTLHAHAVAEHVNAAIASRLRLEDEQAPCLVERGNASYEGAGSWAGS